MQSPTGESLAEFGKKYRTLFVIGEYECSDTPRAARLHGKGRLLLGDFVTGLYALQKATKDVDVTVRDLNIKVQREVRIVTDDQDNLDLCQEIKEKLRQAFQDLTDTGVKKLEEFERRMTKYRDKDLTIDINRLIDRVDELSLKETQPSPARGAKGFIASVASSLRLSITLSVEKPPSERKSPLEVAKTELRSAQEIFTIASETRSAITDCSFEWSILTYSIHNTHTTTIFDILSDPAMSVQNKQELGRLFTKLRDGLQSSVKQMDNVYRDLDARFGHGRGINQRVEEFQTAIAQTTTILKELMSAKHLVNKSQQEKFIQGIYDLGRFSLDQLRLVEAVFREWVLYIRSNSKGPLSFIDDAFELNTETAEAFERRWGPVYTRVDEMLSSGKKRTQKKDESEEVLPITSSSQALSTLKELEQTFFAITGFSVRLPLDLLAYDRRPEDTPRVDSGLAIDPFAAAASAAEKAYKVLEDEIFRLNMFCNPGST
ncbi:hypothetical protein NP233_g12113 [Leucocoprinus birnbaumii]|uniref:Uncharacterized protein n=1 Tax=Leucocoprinus birnbaumii TaxID=56174 RepID=A0AAD5VF97_9AGAR|nr:hypothetical protein NP233_g12113 [Leucocoprinus birnbaumii]